MALKGTQQATFLPIKVQEAADWALCERIYGNQDACVDLSEEISRRTIKQTLEDAAKKYNLALDLAEPSRLALIASLQHRVKLPTDHADYLDPAAAQAAYAAKKPKVSQIVNLILCIRSSGVRRTGDYCRWHVQQAACIRTVQTYIPTSVHSAQQCAVA